MGGWRLTGAEAPLYHTKEGGVIHKTFVENDGRMAAQVTFIVPNGLWADALYLVGDFNGWQRTTHPFHHDERAGQWIITVHLEVGRAYQFRYLRDQSGWLNDHHADAYVVNSYGTANFVVVTDPNFKHYTDE
jgi:1,4-alpha-glucan branching enzyme